MSDNTPEADEFFRKVSWIGYHLSCLGPISIAFIGCYLNVDISVCSRLYPTVFMLGLLWTCPPALYLLYHPVTLLLPTWLTFGHPVTFGGILPDNCDNSTLALGWDGGHDWPCLPSELGTRVANVAGPEGWKWLVYLDEKVALCLAFLALNLILLAMLMRTLRKTPFLAAHVADHAPGTGIETKPIETGDCKKQ
jgi:hypothetical protein